MDIDVPVRDLGAVDASALAERILTQEAAAWNEDLSRQQTYEVHKDTESIVMLFCEEEWPDGEIYREAGWDRLADVAMPLIDSVIETYYEPGGVLLRAMAAKLKVNVAEFGRTGIHCSPFTWVTAFTSPSLRILASASRSKASLTPWRSGGSMN